MDEAAKEAAARFDMKVPTLRTRFDLEPRIATVYRLVSLDTVNQHSAMWEGVNLRMDLNRKVRQRSANKGIGWVGH